MANEISTWFKFAIQQMAAESYLDGINLQDPAAVIRRLVDGNNNGQVIPADQFMGATRFVNLANVANASQITGSAQAFVSRYQIIDHHVNDATGFSATLMRDTQTGEYTLSFRSLEYQYQVDGGDWERDGQGGAAGEIAGAGFALGQLVSMERYYEELKNSGKLPVGATLNVTGYSLGGHLATVFTELHTAEVQHTYTFNAAGRGLVGGVTPVLTEAIRIQQLIEAMDAKFVEFDPTGALTRSGSTANVQTLLWYQPAVIEVAGQFETTGTVSLPTGGLTGGVTRTDGAFQKITQFFGASVTGGDLQLIANSGVHGPVQAILIEGQPLLESLPSLRDYGNAHSITLIVDSFALQALYETVDPDLTQADIESIFKAASAARAATVALAVEAHTAEGDTLERALDALRTLFVPNASDTTTDFNDDTGGFGDIGARTEFYAHQAEVQAAVATQTFSIEPLVQVDSQGQVVPRLTAAELKLAAEDPGDSGLAYRYALRALNPFAVVGVDYVGLGHAADGQLALNDPTTGFGECTTDYLTDRGAFLLAQLDLTLANLPAPLIPSLTHYHDVATGADVPSTSPLLQREYLFGGSASDTLHGSVFLATDDHLYGGGGADQLLGYGGNDYLQGDSGDDWLDGATGSDRLNGGLGFDTYVLDADGTDTVDDGDDRGRLLVNGQLIVGGIRRVGDDANTFHSTDNAFTFVHNGTTLTINGQLTVANWQPGDLGVTLRDLSTLPTGAAPTINYDNGLPTEIYTASPSFGPNGAWAFVAQSDSVNYVVTGGSGPDDVYADTVFFHVSNQVVYGGAESDRIRGSANDRLFGEGGDDVILGGRGQDVLNGGEGRDWLGGDYYDAPGANDYLDGGADADTLLGFVGDDILLGGGGDDHLHADDSAFYAERPVGHDYADGGTGNDLIYGGLGDDVLIGGTENDQLYGDNAPIGDDYLWTELPWAVDENMNAWFQGFTFSVVPGGYPGFYSSTGGSDYLDGGDGDDYLQGDGGDDVLLGGGDNDTLYGDDLTLNGVQQGNDLLEGGSGIDHLYGGGGSDTLLGGSDNDTLIGDFSDDPVGGDDILDGGAGADTLQGEEGHDLLYGGADNDLLFGQAGDDFLSGDDGIDELQGGDDADTLLGGDGDDRLFGQDGDDLLIGGAGTDTLAGGAGADTYLFNLGDGVDTIFDTAGEGNRLVFGAGITADSISLGVGSLLIRVGTAGDAIHIEGFDPANPTGPTGIAQFQFADGSVLTQTELIARGFDLFGTSGDDLLNTGEFYRRAYGLDGVDQLIGGTVDNTLDGGAGVDVLWGRTGHDTLLGGSEGDTLHGEEGNDQLTGGEGNDTLVGGDGDDTLDGGTGTDVLAGDAGNDVYVLAVGDGTDTIQDTVTGTEYNAIRFGAGILPTDLTYVEATNTLSITYSTNGDSVQLTGFDRDGLTGSLVVSTLQFTDGSLVHLADLFPGNHAPTVTNPIADQTVPEDAPFNVVIPANTFADQDIGDVLTLSASLADGTALPAWLSFNATTTTFSGTPDDAQVGTLGLRVTATDPDNASVSDLFNLAVTNVNEAPMVGNTLADQSATEDALFSFVVPGNSFADVDAGDTLTYNATLEDNSPLPAWLTFDPSTRTFSGTPQSGDIGSINVRVTATDTDSLSASDVFALTVQLNHMFTGTPGNDTLTGTSGDDELQGLGGNDVLSGLAGNDLLDGGTGSDSFFGGDGDDILYVDAADISFSGGAGTDTVYAVGTSGVGVSLTAAGIEVAYGGSGNDTFTAFGSPTEVTIVGGVGDDTLTGSDWVDTLIGGAGNDTYQATQVDIIVEQAEEGIDTIVSLNASITLLANFENLTLLNDNSGLFASRQNGTGNELDNIIYGNNQINILIGGDGNDQLYGGGHGDELHGGTGDDYLNAGDLHTATSFDLLYGEEGNDILDGGTKASMYGGVGDDIYIITEGFLQGGPVEYIGEGNDTVQSSATRTLSANVENLILTEFGTINGTGNELNNTIIGNDAANVLDGGLGNDTLNGGAGADTLTGGDGDDVLDGGTGVDSLDGGAGHDTYIFVTGDTLIERSNKGTDTIQSATSYGLGSNFENLTLTGTAAINGTGNSANNVMIGNSAANILNGGTGNDTMSGGAGGDTYVVNATGDVVIENVNEGIDLVQSSLMHTLSAHVENLTLTGNSAINGTGNALDNILTGNGKANVLTGGAGNDTLDGGLGNDTMVGGTGNDTFVVNATGDIVTELVNEGSDTVRSSISYTLGSNVENLVLTGASAINGTGNTLNNVLTGNGVVNTLTGAAGNDQLAGGQGNDVLNGGTGNDLYLVSRGDGQETIQDADTTVGNADRLLYGATINPLDLVLSRQANDLRIALHGTSEQVTVQNWYTSPATNQVETIEAGNGETLLSTQVDQLIQAMTGFTQQTGLTWDQAIDQQPQDVQAVLAANWQ